MRCVSKITNIPEDAAHWFEKYTQITVEGLTGKGNSNVDLYSAYSRTTLTRSGMDLQITPYCLYT